MKLNKLFISLLLALNIAAGVETYSQFNFEGDFRFRAYSDQFKETRDQRGAEDYVRMLARLRSKIKIDKNSTFNVEVISKSDDPKTGVRNISGTGSSHFGVSQLFAEVTKNNFLVFDMARLRVGRQQFLLGKGLSFGESYYFIDKFDGARVDLAYNILNLTLFGAVTGQNVSESGLYPDPGSDQVYVAKLGAEVLNQDLMVYYTHQKLRNPFNDNFIVGAGATSTFLNDNLEYFVEGAYQKYNTAPGLPKKHGIGYMGGISYKQALGPFRTVKIETRYAAFQGDDASTGDIEQFSPPFTSFFWGERAGYANSQIGGDYPHNGLCPEGSRIWYSRIYFVPRMLPQIRLQFQYVNVSDYKNNDGYNEFDDEFAVKLYYRISQNSEMQFRYAKVIPNGSDLDVNKSGTLSSTEDRMFIDRFMLEWSIQF